VRKNRVTKGTHITNTFIFHLHNVSQAERVTEVSRV